MIGSRENLDKYCFVQLCLGFCPQDIIFPSLCGVCEKKIELCNIFPFCVDVKMRGRIGMFKLFENGEG